MKVTMEQIAQAAGVSRATVSLALRDKPQIPAETRRRVHREAQRLGYKPNPLVSALMSTRRRGRARFQATITFLTGHATEDGWRSFTPAYGELFDGARNRAQELGYELETLWWRAPGMTAARLQRVLRARGIHAILIAPQPLEDARVPELDWKTFSVLAVGYSVLEPEFHRISHDYFHGMSMALARCRARGYRRIGLFLDRRVSAVTFNLWHAAYLVEQRTTPGAERIDPLIAEGLEDPALADWLRRSHPDCLVCLNPWRLEDAGLLPRGFPTASLNIDESPRSMPGVSRDFGVIGATAVDRLVSLVQHNDRGIPKHPQTILMEGLWTHDELLPPAKQASLGGRRTKV